jgi:monoamine oxidase
MPNITRRDFLRWAALGASGAAITGWGCSDPLGPEETPGAISGARPPRRVIVVGAGLAGLVAAYELMRAGHEVVVVEARPRPGGRVLTIREPFAADHFVEAGAARIPPGHDLTHAYIRHFGLALEPFYPAAGAYLGLNAGERQAISPATFLAGRPAFTRIAGGTDRLTRSFADRLGARVAYAAPATGIVRRGAEVEVVLATPGGIRSEVGDQVLCTVPFPVLPRIAFDPPLSAGKTRAILNLRYQTSVRVYLQCRTRFWETEGWNGFANTDFPEEVWHPTWSRPGPSGILLSYLRGTRADEFTSLGEDGRVSRLLEHWESVFPGVSAASEFGLSTCWQTEEYSGGAYAAPAPGQLVEFGAFIASSEGRIHFAGDHASGWSGWMQGALASGIRAAREIDGAG